MTLSTTLRN